MSEKVENQEKNVVEIEIEVSAEKFEEGMQKSFTKNAKRFNIPGFRKGKAPRKMVERYYGEQTLYEDAINFVYPDAFDKAVEEKGLEPVQKPELDIKQIGEGKSFIFTAKFAVKPDVELGDYKGIKVKKVKAEVSEEDVNKEIEKAVEKNARLVTVEDRALQTGDISIIDYEGFKDGVPFDGGKGENQSLEIGSGHFIPGFEDQLVGMKTGEEKEINVTFPEEYQAKELAGQPVVFKVKVNEIKFREMPAVDDEFAKDVSEFETLKDYKADIKDKLLKEAEHKAEHENEDNVVDKVVGNASVDIPQVMIDRHVENLIYDFEMRLRYQGLDVEKYLEIMGMDAAAFRGQFAERAEKEVKAQLVIEKIMKVENIQSSDEEYEEELKKYAESYKQSVEDFKKNLREDDIEYIRNNIHMKKTVDFLIENAKFS